MSDQSVAPSPMLMRRAVTRRRPLVRCTVPSSSIVTLSALPISSGVLYLSRADDAAVRAATRKPRSFESAVVICADIPSAKYTSLVSPPKFTSGSTAMDF